MGALITYERGEALERAVRCIIESAGLRHIDPDRVYVIRSRGSRSRAIARVYSMPSAWRYVLSMKPAYLIEFISERFDGLTPERKAEVIVHELLHIPIAFSGGLRPHGKYVNDRVAAKIAARIDERCVEALR
ncbi:MAG: putative metallopeptidase [Acidilobus sp.]